MGVIAMWSGPRNLSTAMMRSFGARADTAVWDEPFFAPYLKVTGKAHPGREETLQVHETDASVVATACAGPVPNNKLYYFQKHMPHHMLPDFPLDWAKDAKHFFLIREPARVINSYAKERAAFDLDDLGYGAQRQLWDKLSDMTGTAPPIVSCQDILQNPQGVLSKLCQALDIAWDTSMLSWAAGRRDTDGAWAPYWYGSVETSTAFSPPPTEKPVLDTQYHAILAAAQSDYDILHARRLTV